MPIRVLVVDDEPLIVDITVEILRLTGFEVLTATSGKAALDVVRREKPDIVLLDVMMPGMDGREVCRQIRADPALANTRIVFHSALDENLVDWRECGADAFRTKNTEILQLADFIAGLVSRDGRGRE